MNPMVKTLAGLGGGWVMSKSVATLARLQSGHGETVAKKLHSRRSFTRNAALGATGVVLAELGIAFGVLIWPNKTGAFGGEITVGANVIPDVNGTPFRDQEGKFYIVHTEDGIQALYWKCVHLGCTVPWNQGEKHFHCPCHGSVYEYNGTRIAGPATRALDLMPSSVNDDGSVTVDTNPSSLVMRPEYRPEDATPYP
ncbi:MAG TPA: Rieske 2Fe-2S domain-containing protein [Thermomicrobiales bacterium]|nr:Rieske 2Fe-2S domain-containing protein [Thermomicrobiales bacterium]